jgi:nucleoside-diphosphate-sugar epimerase
MRVFVTGASGHIGSALVPELQSAGHQVVGLARSDASAQKLEAAGVEVRRGDLDDMDVITKAAADADGVIHLAYRSDLLHSGDAAGVVAANLKVIEAAGEALEGTGKPFVAPAGTLVLWAGGIIGRPGKEDDIVEGGPLAESENATVALEQRGVRSTVIRLSPVVHSALDTRGFTPALIAIARDKGVAAYVGDGANRWPAVHTLDAARLFRLALESAPAGSRLHGVAEEGVPFREFAAAIGRNLGVPTASIAPEDAAGHFGFLAAFAAADNPTSAALTRQRLGWEPVHPGLIADLDDGHYFARERDAAAG